MSYFNRTKGERVGDLGDNYYVAEIEHWIMTPVFEAAIKNGVKQMLNRGAIMPVQFDIEDILIQVYPEDKKVAFVFARKINKVPYLAPCAFDLSDEIIAHLKQVGAWKDKVKNAA